MDGFLDLMNTLVGLDQAGEHLTLLQTTVRAALVYLVGYLFLRVGEHRFVGKNTAFDVVLGFIFGAMLSRAINGTADVLNTILAAAVLLTLHFLFATLAVQSEWLDRWLNGRAIPIIEDGEPDWGTMQKQRINRRLLEENLRLRGTCSDPSEVDQAVYERNGEISVLPRRDQLAEVVHVEVEEGVQTVRIEIRRGGREDAS